MRVASDIGGTFTDLVSLDERTGRLGSAKADTTPPEFERGVIDTLRKAGVDVQAINFFVHGTTVIINALTERKGVRTGLITTRGFRDVLEIGRANRPDLYNLTYAKPRPFVPRALRLEVTERVNYKGEVLVPLAEDEVLAAAAGLSGEQVEAIGICFLHAYANPAHEARAAQLIRQRWPQIAVTASHEITREWREYERTSTTVLNSYVKPIAARYLDRLEREPARRSAERGRDAGAGLLRARRARADGNRRQCRRRTDQPRLLPGRRDCAGRHPRARGARAHRPALRDLSGSGGPGRDPPGQCQHGECPEAGVRAPWV